MDKLILIGGGGHCKSCIDIIENENRFEIKGILDLKEKIGEKILGYEIIGTDDDIEKFVKEDCYFLITLGQIKSAKTRIKIFKKIKKASGTLATVISPRAYVSKHAQIGEGTVVMHDAVINAGATVGKNCIINTKALIEHDCIVKDNCHVAIGATVAGGVIIGEKSFVGANATIVQGVHIPAESFIRACSLIK